MAFFYVAHSGFVLVSMVYFSIVMSSLRYFLTCTGDNLQKVNSKLRVEETCSYSVVSIPDTGGYINVIPSEF